MKYKKEYDFEEFDEFMRHLLGFYEAIQFEQGTRTQKELEMMDELEDEIYEQPCYNSVEEMIDSIKKM